MKLNGTFYTPANRLGKPLPEPSNGLQPNLYKKLREYKEIMNLFCFLVVISQVVQATIIVSKNTDFGMKRLTAGPKVGGSGVNLNDQAILILEPGVTVSNLIIGKPGAKGIDCKGSCTLKNVEGVGTHAAGFGTDAKYWSNSKNAYRVEGGGALDAVQKVFVQQGAGTTYINNFYARNMLSFICRGYQSNNMFNGPTPITKEQIFVGKPLKFEHMQRSKCQNNRGQLIRLEDQLMIVDVCFD
uniref:Probable pectate lyase F n=1 Tax=Ditylenchus dipsaci TaxID=166011 RepID=A0A915CRE9_9BILA